MEGRGVRPSPITFLDLKFLRVSVEAHLGENISAAEDFDFNGAMLQWTLNHGYEEDRKAWWVAVGFATDNKESPDDKSSEPKPVCPYSLDLQAVGWFSVADSIEEERRNELAYENGAALVFGAIREMVATVTGRSFAGKLMLPTPTFVGEYKQLQEEKNSSQ